MLYTIEQLSKLLGRVPKTIYRAHVQYNIGVLQEVAEGRRLLFTETEAAFLEQLFSDRRREKLLAMPEVQKIMDVLRRKPMNVYDLARATKMSKGSLQSLLVAMSNVFEDLLEDQRGILYLGRTPPPDIQECRLLRHVFLSHITGEVVCWKTFSDMQIPDDPGYTLVMTDRCLYRVDRRGQMAYEHDVVDVRGELQPAYEDMPEGFLIVGNLHHKDIDLIKE